MKPQKRRSTAPDAKRRHASGRIENPERVFEAAKDAHRAGDLVSAIHGYRSVISVRPRHADALHLLGFAEFQSSRFESAIRFIESAVEIRPVNPEFQNNLALAFLANGQLDAARRHANEAKRLGHADGHGYLHIGMTFAEQRRLDGAEAAIRLGLEFEPHSADGHQYLGVVLTAQQRHADAEAPFRRAVELRPEFVDAIINLGNSLRDQDRIGEAIPVYQRALRLAPGCAAAHNNLGVALAKDGRPADAIPCYERALRLQTVFPEAMNNLGNALRDIGQKAKAIEYLKEALRQQPVSAEIQSNLGVALRQNGELPEAVSYFRRALVLNPQSVEIHCHLASTLVEWGRLRAAADCFRHVEKLDGAQPLRRLFAPAICPTVFARREDMDEYVRTFEHAASVVRQLPISVSLNELSQVAVPPPFNLQFFAGNVRPWKENYAAIFSEHLRAAYRAEWTETWQGPAGRPRIGFVVTDGHEGIFLKSLSGVLERLSPADFELVVFCSSPGEPRVRSTMTRLDVEVVPLPTRLDRMAQVIDAARCDLLYYWEVGTDAINYFLPFLRLSPIQMTSWGIQVTSGIPQLDCYVSNTLVESTDADDHYSERLVCANTFLTYRPRTQPPVTWRPRDSFPVPFDSHWYVCAQQPGKFHIDFDDMLAGILREDARGCIVMTGDKHGQHTQILRQRFLNDMPDVADRIHILPRLDTDQYLSLLHHAEVLLDPPHFGGVNSTYDGLSLGKAIVVLPSRYHRGRYTFGCYRKMGVEDCIAGTPEQYVQIAVRIACDQNYRIDIERRIAEASSELFEDMGAVREHERIFAELIYGTRP